MGLETQEHIEGESWPDHWDTVSIKRFKNRPKKVLDVLEKCGYLLEEVEFIDISDTETGPTAIALVKSESFDNTHKGVEMFQMCLEYERRLEAAKKKPGSKIPHISIISSGHAIVALANLLKDYDLPEPCAVLDHSERETKREMIDKLEKIGVKLVYTDLSGPTLTRKKILELTDNEGGMEATSISLKREITKLWEIIHWYDELWEAHRTGDNSKVEILLINPPDIEGKNNPWSSKQGKQLYGVGGRTVYARGGRGWRNNDGDDEAI